MYLGRILFYLGGIMFLISLALIRSCAGDRVEDAPPLSSTYSVETRPPAAPKGAFHRGMVVGIFPYEDEKPQYRETFDELYDVGASVVSLNFNWFMNTIYDLTVYKGVADSDNQTPSDEILGQAIDDAHKAGLEVMLFPAIYVLNLSKGEWRGRIKPASWDTWFDSYGQLCVDVAKLGQKHHAEYFCIGIELISTEKFTKHWRKIIKDIRAVYDGKLCYSSNWDARKINPWFHDIDMLAMNAYYELSKNKNATVDELVNSWRKIRNEIVPWKEAFNKPLIITEIGYRSADGAVTQPWNYFLAGGVDLEEQRRAYQAFFKAWFDDDVFNGVYFYHWFGKGGPNDKSYTPRHKPAEKVLRYWYKKIAERDKELFAKHKQKKSKSARKADKIPSK